MVVAKDGQVAPRPVKIGGSQGNQWVILDGLKPGEMVMVDGFQKLRPGSPVKPVPWSAQPASGAAQATAAPSAPAASAASAASQTARR
jgi:membrane fusion protein (multidrug efflux system)